MMPIKPDLYPGGALGMLTPPDKSRMRPSMLLTYSFTLIFDSLCEVVIDCPQNEHKVNLELAAIAYILVYCLT